MKRDNAGPGKTAKKGVSAPEAYRACKRLAAGLAPDSTRKAAGWSPVVVYPNGAREVLRCKYSTPERASAHAALLIAAYVKTPQSVPSIGANRILNR